MATSVDFLNFPKEIRDEIYENIDNGTSSSDSDIKAFQLTRKNLRLTCKQINEEYTPRYMKDMTIVFMAHSDHPTACVAEFESDILRAKHRSINFVESIRSIVICFQADELRFCTCEPSTHSSLSLVDSHGLQNAERLGILLRSRQLGLRPEKLTVTFDLDEYARVPECGALHRDPEWSEETYQWANIRCVVDDFDHGVMRRATKTIEKGTEYAHATFTLPNWKPGQPKKSTLAAKPKVQKRLAEQESGAASKKLNANGKAVESTY